jgi:predicted GNAT family N-acyltransferase
MTGGKRGDPRPRMSPASPMTTATTRAPAAVEIRVLATPRELVESYRLRYEVYGALGYLRRPNRPRLDIDEYDSSSIPFGAFDASSGELIGTLRLVKTHPQPDYDYLVRTIVASCGDAGLARQAWAPQPHPLPSIISEEFDRQVEAFNTERFEVHELSRCIVRLDRRGGGVSRRLMELGLAYAAQQAPSVVIGGCLPEHVAMYARYGYVQLPFTDLDHFDSVGRLACAVVCRTDRVPQPTQEHIDELVRSLRSGAAEHTLERGRRSRVVYRLATPRRARRRTIEW